MHNVLDIVGVARHLDVAQNTPCGRPSSPGLYREVRLDHEHIGCGARLGESPRT